VYLFAATLFVCCFGAAAESVLGFSFEVTQIMGWKYNVNKKPRDSAIFNLIFSLYIIVGSLLVALAGIDPLELTIFATGFTAFMLPVVVGPFLAVMNDPMYLKDQTNGWVSNIAVLLIIMLAFILSITSIPLMIVGEG
jgi:Mn2+/Fe2+ NRAMP family transporter